MIVEFLDLDLYSNNSRLVCVCLFVCLKMFFSEKVYSQSFSDSLFHVFMIHCNTFSNINNLVGLDHCVLLN